MVDQEKYIEALIKLHSGLERQGPGDPVVSEFILDRLPEMPKSPRVADIGCGAGGGALILARRFHSKVRAVDFSKEFLSQMMFRARQEGLESLIEPIECDMGSLDWESGSIDLLWSEGAAYNITFEGALKAWRPLMAQGGVAVISEMNFFSEPVPEAVSEYVKSVYPGVKTEPENVDWINASGYEFLELHRLPSDAWWKNYYDPLRKKIASLDVADDEIMKMVIQETEAEMEFFRKHSGDYGYTFYIMRAV